MRIINEKTIALKGALGVLLLLQHVSGQINYVSDLEGNTILDLQTCETFTGPSSRGEWPLIFPGTKWCGPGNRAENYFDLGSRAAEDSCCREHDHCPLNLEPGQCRGDVCNQYSVTLSHCACDARFRRCLQAANTDVADFIGWIFFNLVHVKCFKSRVSCNDFREECPIALHSVIPYRSERHSTAAGTLASALFGLRKFS